MSKIKVLLVDDHRLFREMLRQMLDVSEDIVVVGEAKDGLEAIYMCQKLLPDVVLMDVVMPSMDGVEATLKIKSTYPNVAVLMLTMHESDEHLFKAVRAGASGYISKDEEPDKVIEAVKLVSKGEDIIGSVIYRKMLNELEHIDRAEGERKLIFDSLTPREIDILEALVEGKSNREIAAKLFISEKTIKNQLTNIFRKLHVNSRTKAILKVIKLDLLNLSQELET